MIDVSDSDPNIETVLLTADEVQRRVVDLAAEIADDYHDRECLSLVGVLKGACVFMSDLGRQIHRQGGPKLTYDFIQASTYGNGLKGPDETERAVHVNGLSGALRGRDVLLVEDILDQGFTLSEIRRVLIEREGVRSVRCCVLLVKDLAAPTPEVAAVRREFVPEYAGFHVPDRWVAGYGLDVAELYRELPCVVIVKESQFSD